MEWERPLSFTYAIAVSLGARAATRHRRLRLVTHALTPARRSCAGIKMIEDGAYVADVAQALGIDDDVLIAGEFDAVGTLKKVGTASAAAIP
eukprot:5231672-Prymnesium_polylepis.1